MNAALETTLAVELFLNENYCFRRNILNGKVEFMEKPNDEAECTTPPDEAWRPLTQEALNSIIRRAKKEQVCEKGSPKTEIMEFVHSDDVPVHNPIGDYMKLLPKWGVDVYEYGRYIEHANEAGLDIRNEGTLYPPVTGGRKAFMRRLEELEANAAKMKAAAIDKAMSERAPEIAAFQEAVERTKTLHGCGYKIVLAKTQSELLAEGKKMGNCIGNGTYGRGVALGNKLIVMLRIPGVRRSKSFCDIEIDRHTWKVRQCYTKGNRIPPDEVRELANRIATFLKAEYKRQQRKAKKGKAA